MAGGRPGPVSSAVSLGPGGAVPGSGLPVSLPSLSGLSAISIGPGGAVPGSGLPVPLPYGSVPSAISICPGGVIPGSSLPGTVPCGSAFPKFDEDWIRLAIVVHEFSCEAVAWVLDDAISKKHPSLTSKDFHERLEEALRLSPQLAKALLTYQVPKVFPSSGFGKYADFDIGLLKNLISYFVGNPQWAQATAGLPAVENLKTYNWGNASPLALVALLSEFRNWIFHNTCGITNFSQLWDVLLKVLHGLKYDTSKVSHFKSGPLDYGSKVVVETIKEALRTVKEGQRTVTDLLTEAIRLQEDPAWKQEFADLKSEVQKEAEYSKKELIAVQDRLERMQIEFEKLQVSREVRKTLSAVSYKI